MLTQAHPLTAGSKTSPPELYGRGVLDLNLQAFRSRARSDKVPSALKLRLHLRSKGINSDFYET